MGATILVIEDEPMMREVLASTLTTAGYNVITAANGEEGMLTLHVMQPDLIICDRSMPKMSGYEFLNHIRTSFPNYNSMPFIFLTALSDMRDRKAVDHLGPAAYLSKPFEYGVLLDTVKKNLMKT